MPWFSVAVREHAYTGRFYSDVVQAESCEEALQAAGEQQPAAEQAAEQAGEQQPAAEQAAEQAAVPQPAPGPPRQRGFSVVVREQAYPGRFYSDVVQAESCEKALEVAAVRAAAPQPSIDPKLQADAAGRPRCADVWIYTLLHCELVAGHDPPHMAVAHGYGRLVSWVRDDRGIAHARPDPATGAHVVSPVTQPPTAIRTTGSGTRSRPRSDRQQHRCD